MFWFKYNNIDSREKGVKVLNRPDIVSPQTSLETIQIDGRDTPILRDLGKLSYEISFDIAVEERELVDEVLEWLQGEGKFVRSDYEDRYQTVKIIDGISFEYLVDGLYRASVTLVTLDPYFYPLNPQTTSVGSSTTLTNEGNHVSYPLIDITKESGQDSVKIEYKNNILRYTFPVNETKVTIDTKTRQAYHEEKDRTLFLEIERDYGLYLPKGDTEVKRDHGDVKFRKYSRWI